jgi:hypothetical protein
MRYSIDVVLFCLLLLALYLDPGFMAVLASNPFGRLVLICAVLFLVLRHTLLGLLMAILVLVAFQQGSSEMFLPRVPRFDGRPRLRDAARVTGGDLVSADELLRPVDSNGIPSTRLA